MWEGEFMLSKEEVWAKGKLLVVSKDQCSDSFNWCFGLDVHVKALYMC